MSMRPAGQSLPEYEIYAIRYATRSGSRSQMFLGGDPHDGPMDLDYYVWVAKSPERTFVIDVGFNREVADSRQRRFLRCPIDTLAEIGVDPERVEDVIITHLHYDHVGNLERFPNAQFHLQEPEIHYAVGRHMRHAHLNHAFEVEDIVTIVRANYKGRVQLYNGQVDLAPGISLHTAPGHSAGLQFVTVNTRRGTVVVASDATHFYENFETGRPFVMGMNIPDMLEGFDKIQKLAPSKDHIIPGHDPLVMKKYPAPRPGLEGVVARLDVAPL